MSILVELDFKDHAEEDRDDELLVFGYSCRVYRDNETALAEENGAFLIPWMGDPSFMIDRYDGRSHLADKGLFGLKSNMAQRMTKEEEELEEQLDEERYLSLNKDIMEEDLMKEEEEKRMLEAFQPEGYFNAVSYAYSDTPPPPPKGGAPAPPPAPPISSVMVDHGKDSDRFTPPEDLPLPDDLTLPSTNKLHAIIEKTAAFIAHRGAQMELIIRIKQKSNPYFAFLEFEDHLNPYYKHLLSVIRHKLYIPKLVETSEKGEGVEEAGGVATPPFLGNSALSSPVIVAGSTSDGSDSDGDEEYELHPLLRSSLAAKAPSTNGETTASASFFPLEDPRFHPSSVGGANGGGGSTGGTVPPDYQQYYASYMQQWSEHCQSMAHQQGSSSGSSSSGFDYNSYASAMMQYYQYYSSYFASTSQDSHVPAEQIAQHPYQAALARLPQSILDQPTNPPPPDIQCVVDKMAEYAAKNGEEFEATVLIKNPNNPRFAFLRPGNEYHPYYTTKKLVCINQLCEEKKLEDATKPIMHSLKPGGKVGFSIATAKLQPSEVTLEDPSSEEDDDVLESREGGREGSSSAAAGGGGGRGDKDSKDGDQSTKKPKVINSSYPAKHEDQVADLEEREKQVARRRKAAMFIEQLKRKRSRQIEEEKELSRLGLNEDVDEFVGPKRPNTMSSELCNNTT